MKYYISDEYDCLYFMKDEQLACIPIMTDGTLNSAEWTIVELPHDEIPQDYVDKVLAKLK